MPSLRNMVQLFRARDAKAKQDVAPSSAQPSSSTRTALPSASSPRPPSHCARTTRARQTLTRAEEILTHNKRRLTQSLGLSSAPTRRFTVSSPRTTTSVPYQSLYTSEPLPAASGATMLEQTLAAARRQDAANSLAKTTLAFDESTVALLLRRDEIKTETAENLIASPVERALDSILSDELITNMPAALRAPFSILATQASRLLCSLEKSRRDRWLADMVDELRTEAPRPWSPKTPILTFLCSETSTPEEKFDALIAYWQEPAADGFAAMASMTLVRALYMSAERLGISPSTVPFATEATNYYVQHLLPQTGRLQVSLDPQVVCRKGAGITVLDAPSPIDSSWMVNALQTAYRQRPDLTHSSVREALQYGNGFGVGISGSTPTLLHALAYYQQQGVQGLDALALTLGIAAMLCYDGGHSLHEAFAAAQQFPKNVQGQLAGLANYRAGHARGFFVDQVEAKGAQVADRSLQRLASYLLENEDQFKR